MLWKQFAVVDGRRIQPLFATPRVEKTTSSCTVGGSGQLQVTEEGLGLLHMCNPYSQ